MKNVHKKVLSFVSSTDEGVIPETSRTNKTEHFFYEHFSHLTYAISRLDGTDRAIVKITYVTSRWD